MTERDFIYWLNGFLELSGATELDEKQVKCIKDHLKLVMKKETPEMKMTINPNQTRPGLIC